MQQREDGLDQRQVVRPRGPGHQRGVREAGVLEQHQGVAAEQVGEPLAPVAARPRRGEADRAEQLLQDRRVQLRGVRQVHVERGRSGVELLGQATHGDPLQPLGPHQGDGGGHDALVAEGGLGGPLAAAAGGGGPGCHGSSLTNMFVTNKYATRSSPEWRSWLARRPPNRKPDPDGGRSTS